MAGIGSGRLTTGALRYRAGQAVALFVLSLLGVAACAFGPLYERAVEHASLRLTLTNTPIFSRGLSVRAVSSTGSLDSLLPAEPMRRFYREPVTSVDMAVDYVVGREPVSGVIVNRTDECAHLRLDAGRCATRPGEVMASTSAARALRMALGQRLPITVSPPGGDRLTAGSLTIVGFYRPYDPHDDYWFDRDYASATGGASDNNAATSGGALFATSGFVEDISAQVAAAQKGVNPPDTPPDLLYVTETDLALRVDQVDLDNAGALRTEIARVIAVDKTTDPDVDVQSSFPDALDQVDRGRRQARSVIPAFAIELALLVLVVVGIVVVAVADQRRPEFALGRLRGRSAAGSARLLDREFGTAVLLSVVPGVLLAWYVCDLACRWWLSGGARPELRWPVLAAAGSAVLAELVIIAVAAWLTARKPVHDLLRRVAPRTSRRGVGAVEAAVAAAAVAGTFVVLSGDGENAVAVLTPGFIALLAGLLVSRLLAWSGRVAGQRAFLRGRVASGLAGLQIARRPGVRRVVTLLCVATALIVSAADQWRVSDRNRSVRAGADIGASVVLTVHTPSAGTLSSAVAAADPDGRYATPVVAQRPVNGPPVLAVEPSSFARVAAWGWDRDRPAPALMSGLRPQRPRPISFTGTSLQLRLSVDLKREPDPAADIVPPHPSPVFLLVSLRRSDGEAVDAKLGPLPEGTGRPAMLSTAVACESTCRLSQIGLLRTNGDGELIEFAARINGAYAGNAGQLQHVDLGSAAQWAEATQETTNSQGMQQIHVDSVRGSLTLSGQNSGALATVQHLAAPIALPAVVAGAVPDDRDDRGYLSDNGIDGIATPYKPIGTLPLLPGAGGPAFLVDLDTAAALATGGLGDSTAAVWLSADDPARERTLSAALAQHGVSVVSRDSAARHRATLAATAPAWAMQFALVTALLAVVIAAVLIVIAASTSRRTRRYDMSALELVGVGRRTLRRALLVEQAVVTIVGVAVGTVVGVIGAHLALPSVPIFLVDADQPVVLRPVVWGSVVLAAVLALVALSVVSTLVGLQMLRQVAPDRLRESQL